MRPWGEIADTLQESAESLSPLETRQQSVDFWAVVMILECCFGMMEKDDPHFGDIALLLNDCSTKKHTEIVLDIAYYAAYLRNGRGVKGSYKRSWSYIRNRTAMMLVRMTVADGATLGDAAVLVTGVMNRWIPVLNAMKASSLEKLCQGIPADVTQNSIPFPCTRPGEFAEYLRTEAPPLDLRLRGERR